MNKIKTILMNHGGMLEEAEALIKEVREQMYQYINDGDQSAAYEICSEYFELGPDYIIEFIQTKEF